MKEPKFKVGDWAWLVLPLKRHNDDLTPPPSVHILEVTTQVCEAGISQISYIVRMHQFVNGQNGVTSPLVFREMELTDNPERQK